jgi:hypothetical protein
MNGVKVSRGESDRVSFWCPGCDQAHTIGPAWDFNGDDSSPTFTPSVKVEGVQWGPTSGFHKPRHAVAPGGATLCHSFVTEGRIQFLDDSTHNLAGETVDLPDWEDHKHA